VQHERKPIVDRNKDALKGVANGDSDGQVLVKRNKKETNGDSVNYLSLFQSINPLLMHAASGVSSTLSAAPSPKQAPEVERMKTDQLNSLMDSKIPEMPEYETVLEQKLLNDALDMIEAIEETLQGTECATPVVGISQVFFDNLQDEQNVQFKIVLPNLLPKMHFVCETGSRIIFKTIDWLRDVQVWQHFGIEDQHIVLNWMELLVVGLSQVIGSNAQGMSLKSMIISSLTNYVKSLIIYSTSEQTLATKSELKSVTSAGKLKKMLSNILLLNAFIDSCLELQLDNVEFAYLRMLCLFNGNKFYGNDFNDNSRIKQYNEKIHINMQHYVKSRQKSGNEAIHRSLQISSLQSTLAAMDAKLVEFLFFNNLIGFIRIENIIPYIMNLNASAAEIKQEKDLILNDENNSHSMNSDDNGYYNSRYSDGIDERC